MQGVEGQESPDEGAVDAAAAPLGIPEALLREAHHELRSLAAWFLEKERRDHTLQPTALVHELWIRCAERDDLRFDSRGQLLAFASTVFRRILIDHARRRCAEMRGGGGGGSPSRCGRCRRRPARAAGEGWSGWSG